MKSRSKRILLVEDSEDSRFSLSKLLQLEGYIVLEAADGVQAIQIATRERPDLILMDLSLPVVDGLTAARTIREAPELAGTPIIALSGHDAADFGSDAEEAGFTNYATKPVDFDALIVMLSKYL
jgi:two-component system cell cycle response regulator DivK